jgi:hypothetical protein
LYYCARLRLKNQYMMLQPNWHGNKNTMAFNN